MNIMNDFFTQSNIFCVDLLSMLANSFLPAFPADMDYPSITLPALFAAVLLLTKVKGLQYIVAHTHT